MYYKYSVIKESQKWMGLPRKVQNLIYANGLRDKNWCIYMGLKRDIVETTISVCEKNIFGNKPLSTYTAELVSGLNWCIFTQPRFKKKTALFHYFYVRITPIFITPLF